MGRFVILLLCAAPVFAAPVPKAVKKAEATLTGTWEVVERRNDGQLLYPTGREFWVFAEDSYVIFDGLKDETELSDPKRRVVAGKRSGPDPQDATVLDLNDGPQQNISRMLLDGDTLHIAITLVPKNGRPAEAKPGQGIAYIKFQRVDPAKLKAK
jgi:hypothetical protein